MKRGILVIVVLLMIQGALANEYYININQKGEDLLINQFITLENEQEIKVFLPSNYESLTSNVNFSVSGNYLSARGKRITLSYIQEKEDSFDKLVYFNIKLNGQTNFSRLVIDVFLDERYSLNKELTTPKNFNFISDGSSEIVSWRFEESPGMDLIIALEEENKYFRTYFYILVGTLLFLGGLYYFFSIKKSGEEHLLKDEVRVIELLKKANRRESWQRQIQEETGFSKAKLSRMIRNLESRDLIEKIPMGNTNKIKLK